MARCAIAARFAPGRVRNLCGSAGILTVAVMMIRFRPGRRARGFHGLVYVHRARTMTRVRHTRHRPRRRDPVQDQRQGEHDIKKKAGHGFGDYNGSRKFPLHLGQDQAGASFRGQCGAELAEASEVEVFDPSQDLNAQGRISSFNAEILPPPTLARTLVAPCDHGVALVADGVGVACRLLRFFGCTRGRGDCHKPRTLRGSGRSNGPRGVRGTLQSDRQQPGEYAASTVGAGSSA